MAEIALEKLLTFDTDGVKYSSYILWGRKGFDGGVEAR